MTKFAFINPGDVFESTDPRDVRAGGRRVTVDHVSTNGDTIRVRNERTGRISVLSQKTLDSKYRRAQPQQTARTRAPKSVPPLTTVREQELMRIVKAKFSDFNRRQQHFYLGGGMSTSHVVVSAIADIKSLQAFWPRELVTTRRFGGTSYTLEDSTLRRVQDRIRETLNLLEKKGYLEKIGNTDERRWKPTYIHD